MAGKRGKTNYAHPAKTKVVRKLARRQSRRLMLPISLFVGQLRSTERIDVSLATAHRLLLRIFLYLINWYANELVHVS